MGKNHYFENPPLAGTCPFRPLDYTYSFREFVKRRLNIALSEFSPRLKSLRWREAHLVYIPQGGLLMVTICRFKGRATL